MPSSREERDSLRLKLFCRLIVWTLSTWINYVRRENWFSRAWYILDRSPYTRRPKKIDPINFLTSHKIGWIGQAQSLIANCYPRPACWYLVFKYFDLRCTLTLYIINCALQKHLTFSKLWFLTGKNVVTKIFDLKYLSTNNVASMFELICEMSSNCSTMRVGCSCLPVLGLVPW